MVGGSADVLKSLFDFVDLPVREESVHSCRPLLHHLACQLGPTFSPSWGPHFLRPKIFNDVYAGKGVIP